MTKYQWADTRRAPSGVSADAVGEAIEELHEPTPEALLDASKMASHVLHEHLWAEGDQVWANKARLDECRQIISCVRSIKVIGGKTITYRPVEFVRADGDGKWTRMDDILADRSLHLAYMAEVKRLQEQAVNKLEVFMTLLRGQEEQG